MTKRTDFIALKIADIESQISYLSAHPEAVVVGGRRRNALPQSDRLTFMQELTSFPEGRILALKASLEQTLGVDGVAAKYGDVRGLPDASVELLSKLELIDIALGLHPALVGK